MHFNVQNKIQLKESGKLYFLYFVKTEMLKNYKKNNNITKDNIDRIKSREKRGKIERVIVEVRNKIHP